jgi:hypothetical protein
MGAEDGDVYILRTDGTTDTEADSEAGESAWVSPEPASDAILGAVAEAMDAEAEDLGPLSEYVALDDVAAVFDDDDSDSLSFTVEDHEVTVRATGEIDVET